MSTPRIRTDTTAQFLRVPMASASYDRGQNHAELDATFGEHAGMLWNRAKETGRGALKRLQTREKNVYDEMVTMLKRTSASSRGKLEMVLYSERFLPVDGSEYTAEWKVGGVHYLSRPVCDPPQPNEPGMENNFIAWGALKEAAAGEYPKYTVPKSDMGTPDRFFRTIVSLTGQDMPTPSRASGGAPPQDQDTSKMVHGSARFQSSAPRRDGVDLQRCASAILTAQHM